MGKSITMVSFINDDPSHEPTNTGDTITVKDDNSMNATGTISNVPVSPVSSTAQLNKSVTDTPNHNVRPLAVRMRPHNLNDVVGQDAALTVSSPLRILARPTASMTMSAPPSIILTGPPGVGKTTIARILAEQSGRRLVELSATSSSVKDVKEKVREAKELQSHQGIETILFIDEIHRFTKSQQDALLSNVENRDVTLVAATTENPSYAVIKPLLSRAAVVKLQPLNNTALELLINRALSSPHGLQSAARITDNARNSLIMASQGDARRALGLLELAFNTVVSMQESLLQYEPHDNNAPNASKTGLTNGDTDNDSNQDRIIVHEDSGTNHGESQYVIDTDVMNHVLESVSLTTYDRDGDDHYDMISAFIKSMRGSDAQAAVYWAARMLDAGEDPMVIARRVVIAAAEEVGLANPQALIVAQSAMQAVSMIGMPEARILLSEAILTVATSPKSNASYVAMNQALDTIHQGARGQVPFHLRNAVSKDKALEGYGEGYVYAHDEPYGIAAQQYLPDGMEGTVFYTPKHVGDEKEVGRRMNFIEPRLHPEETNRS